MSGIIIETGVTGETGPTGPTGPGLTSYGYVYHKVEGTDCYVGPNADLPFNSNGQLVGMTHTEDTIDITVSTAGYYRVDYSVNVSTEDGAIAVAVNGTVESSTRIYVFSVGNITGSAIVWLDAGDKVSLRNPSMEVLTVSVMSEVGGADELNAASLVIKLFVTSPNLGNLHYRGFYIWSKKLLLHFRNKASKKP